MFRHQHVAPGSTWWHRLWQPVVESAWALRQRPIAVWSNLTEGRAFWPAALFVLLMSATYAHLPAADVNMPKVDVERQPNIAVLPLPLSAVASAMLLCALAGYALGSLQRARQVPTVTVSADPASLATSQRISLATRLHAALELLRDCLPGALQVIHGAASGPRDLNHTCFLRLLGPQHTFIAACSATVLRC